VRSRGRSTRLRRREVAAPQLAAAAAVVGSRARGSCSTSSRQAARVSCWCVVGASKQWPGAQTRCTKAVVHAAASHLHTCARVLRKGMRHRGANAPATHSGTQRHTQRHSHTHTHMPRLSCTAPHKQAAHDAPCTGVELAHPPTMAALQMQGPGAPHSGAHHLPPQHNTTQQPAVCTRRRAAPAAKTRPWAAAAEAASSPQPPAQQQQWQQQQQQHQPPSRSAPAPGPPSRRRGQLGRPAPRQPHAIARAAAIP
jgi:hypothetical protein